MKQDVRYLDGMTGHGPFRLTEDGAKPNIVFISLDMVPREFYLGGVPKAFTPNLQALQDGHIFFSRAYATSPLCSPSRAAYLTGRHSYITTNSERAHDGHEVHLRESDIIYPEYLKALGYQVRHVGKCHVGAHKFVDVFSENDSPWDRWSPPWFDDDSYTKFLRQKGLDRLVFSRSITGRNLVGEEGGSFYGGWIANQGGNPFPKDATYPAFLVERAIQTLESRGDREAPVYLQLDFFGPHQPFAIPGGMEEREVAIRKEIELPKSYQEIQNNDYQPPWQEPRVYQLYRRSWGLNDSKTLVDYRVANQLQFELLDEMIGRLFDSLKEQGLYDDTWIVVIADHGEMNGEWALIDKGAFLNPQVIQVPIFMKPDSKSEYADRRLRIDEPVSLVDLAPTLLGLVGVETDTRMDGVSLLNALKGSERACEKPILAEVWSHAIPNPCIGIVISASDENSYLYSFNTSDEIDELYSLELGAPLVNLGTDDTYRSIQDEALNRLYGYTVQDVRWRGYKAFLELTHAERIVGIGGDRQLFF